MCSQTRVENRFAVEVVLGCPVNMCVWCALELARPSVASTCRLGERVGELFSRPLLYPAAVHDFELLYVRRAVVVETLHLTFYGSVRPPNAPHANISARDYIA